MTKSSSSLWLQIKTFTDCDSTIPSANYAICGTKSKTCEELAPNLPDLVFKTSNATFTMPGASYILD